MLAGIGTVQKIVCCRGVIGPVPQPLLIRYNIKLLIVLSKMKLILSIILVGIKFFFHFSKK